MLDTMGESHDPDGIGFSDGDPDYQAKVIPGTLMPVPWAQRPLSPVMVTLVDDDGEPYYYARRNVLRRVAQRLLDLGLKSVVAFRSEDRRVGEECVRTCRARRSTDH